LSFIGLNEFYMVVGTDHKDQNEDLLWPI